MSKIYITVVIAFFSMLLFISGNSFARVTGECSNCHTMHNSQTPWPSGWGAQVDGPRELLLVNDCMGCHGMGGASKIVTVGGCDFPQVYHTASDDLAGGNFAYITGDKGGGASDAKGHNVIELGSNDGTLYDPPGSVHGNNLTNTNFTCAGTHGCHGIRYREEGTGLGLKGAHHQNVDGECGTADEVYDSYRFLKGVMGFENMGTYKYENEDKDNHNEYYGTTTPGEYSCEGCHTGTPNETTPQDHTISGFCATCHGHFHRVQGIGGDITSPFTRHPTDIVLPSSGEYGGYTTYSVEAPIARPSVYSSISGDVAPGTDIVMCLSCHAAHGTDYPDMLKWDYGDMIAGDDTKSGGCFTCHTTKNEP